MHVFDPMVAYFVWRQMSTLHFIVLKNTLTGSVGWLGVVCGKTLVLESGDILGKALWSV